MSNCKSDDLKYIEECIGYIKIKEDIAENIQRIERALTRIFNIPFDVTISDNDVHQFFAVNVFPNPATINGLGKMFGKSLYKRLDDKEIRSDCELLVERWQTNSANKWQIEIDADMLWSLDSTYGPADIVAAMIHEIIRIIYTPTVPITVYTRFRSIACDVNRTIRALFRQNKIQLLLGLAILECCESKIFTTVDGKRDCDSGIMCDMMTSLGCIDDYNRLIDKFINMGLTSTFIYRTEKDVEKDIRIIMLWIVSTIKELEFNKKRLRESLESETIRASSCVVKRYLEDIREAFFGGTTDSYRKLLSEQWNAVPVDKYASMVAYDNLIKSCKRIMTEAANSVFDKNGKLKKVSQLDIDVLAVDAERIETHDDKIYLLDRIYDKLQILEAGIDYLESGDRQKVVKQSKNTLIDMKKQLEDLRKVVLSTRIIEKEYGVFIKYPKGYEG